MASAYPLPHGHASARRVLPGFIAQAGRCWQNVYDRNLQTTHCRGDPSWTGRWSSPKGDRWFSKSRSAPLEGLTGLQEFRWSRS